MCCVGHCLLCCTELCSAALSYAALSCAKVPAGRVTPRCPAPRPKALLQEMPRNLLRLSTSLGYRRTRINPKGLTQAGTGGCTRALPLDVRLGSAAQDMHGMPPSAWGTERRAELSHLHRVLCHFLADLLSSVDTKSAREGLLRFIAIYCNHIIYEHTCVCSKIHRW